MIISFREIHHSKMSSLRVLPTPAGSVVSQEELNHWFGIQNNIRRLRRLRVRFERGLLDRLAAGAECETGPHVASVRVRYRGSRKITKLEIQ